MPHACGAEWAALPSGVLIELREVLLEEVPGNLGHYPGAIAGVIVCRAGPPMLHAPQGRECLQHEPRGNHWPPCPLQPMAMTTRKARTSCRSHVRCHGIGNSAALTCSTMTWLRRFLRLAMNPTCVPPQRSGLCRVALACIGSQNVTYPTSISLLQYVLQIHSLALMTRGRRLLSSAWRRIRCEGSGALGDRRAGRRL